MSAKYFEYLIIVFFFIFWLFATIIWLKNARLKYLQNLAQINILKRQQKINHKTLYSAEIIKKCTALLFYKLDNKSHRVLAFFTGGRIEKAVAFIGKKDELLALLLLAHIDAAKAYRRMVKQKKIWLNSSQYSAYLPILAHLNADTKTLLDAINKLDYRYCLPIKNSAAASFNYIAAYAHLLNGDMLSASQKASAALKYFQKRQYAIETAACHLVLAEIYRLSCVNDIAETMLNSALKIYQIRKAALFSAQTVTIKGMLMLFENRFAEAADFYEKALNMPITDQLRADIYNQKALLNLAQNDISSAKIHLEIALQIQQKLHNSSGIAYTLQLSAHADFMRKKPQLAAQNAQAAADIYQAQDNFSAVAECLYLAAEAFYTQKKYTAAEKNLRQILALSQHHTLNFHHANAYSLLGLIYLQKKDLPRAKALFTQALNLEHQHRRCAGLAADYSNLALVDEMLKNSDTASKNRQAALEYARQTQDAELIALINKTNQKI